MEDILFAHGGDAEGFLAQLAVESNGSVDPSEWQLFVGALLEESHTISRSLSISLSARLHLSLHLSLRLRLHLRLHLRPEL